MKIPYTNIPDGGILAEIAGSGSWEGYRSTCTFKADCDALTMEEAEENMKQKRTCMSENHGVAHMWARFSYGDVTGGSQNSVGIKAGTDCRNDISAV